MGVWRVSDVPVTNWSRTGERLGCETGMRRRQPQAARHQPRGRPTSDGELKPLPTSTGYLPPCRKAVSPRSGRRSSRSTFQDQHAPMATPCHVLGFIAGAPSADGRPRRRAEIREVHTDEALAYASGSLPSPPTDGGWGVKLARAACSDAPRWNSQWTSRITGNFHPCLM